MRPGAKALSVLAVPLNVHVLMALEEEGRPLIDLSRMVGHPPASTMRAYLRTLADLEVLERRQEEGFPGPVSYVLTGSGRKLLRVAEALQAWLRDAPDGPVSLGSPAAKSAIKALGEAWSATMVRAIAARAYTLTELDRLIPQISYPTLERRLTAMRLVGLVEAQPNGAGRGTPYKATPWLRHAVPSLAAAIGWERGCALDRTVPLGRVDIEAAFLLAIPLITLAPEVSGTCRLAVEIRNGSELDYAGVVVAVNEGKVVSCVARLDGQADAWVVGTPLEWFGWVGGCDGNQVELGGDASVAVALADGLRAALVPGNLV